MWRNVRRKDTHLARLMCPTPRPRHLHIPRPVLPRPRLNQRDFRPTSRLLTFRLPIPSLLIPSLPRVLRVLRVRSMQVAEVAA
jgi:hypothetical protein